MASRSYIEECQSVSSSLKEREKEEGLRTVDCLRARLLAERQASRLAKQSAQLMADKLMELEKQLKGETELREKTEKKLKYLKKKLLESSMRFSVSPTLDQSEQQSTSSVSENGIVSSESSMTAEDSGIRIPIREVEEELKISETPTASKRTQGVALAEDKKSCSSVGDSTVEEIGPAREECRTDERSDVESMRNPETQLRNDNEEEDGQVDNTLAIVPVVTLGEANSKPKSSSTSRESKVAEEEGEEHGQVDNTLAIVPVVTSGEANSKPKSSEVAKMMSSGSVSEVLDTLRRARESIQRSLKKKPSYITRVGPPLCPPPPRAAQLC